LTSEQIANDPYVAPATFDTLAESPTRREDYERNLTIYREAYHSQCLFNREPSLVPEHRFWFDDTGALLGEFTCDGVFQGHNTMIHGGIIAAIIDSSMAQCLMGHGIVGYTTNLSIKYRKPVYIEKLTALKTTVTDISIGCLYMMKCEIVQRRSLVVQATGRFYKVNQQS
jgi:hypothetical protein